MAAAGEIARAYVSIIPETSKIAPGIKASLGKAENDAVKQGEGIGSKLMAGLSKTMKVTAASVGVSVGGALGTSLWKGFGRLTAIDNAQAKLRGLGNDAQTVGDIMENALASVKGTAFGLEEAVTTSSGLVAAGIAPGKELEGVLKTVADTAAIAGISMADMGQIFGSVAARGKLQGDDLLQLTSRGVPVLQMLAEETGKTSEEISKMVSKGQIDFATFERAMNAGVGGAAKEMGNTFSGALANMQAAMGRFGATLLGPVFASAPPLFNAVGDAFDDLGNALNPVAERFGQVLAPAMETVGSYIGTTLAPKLGELAGAFGNIAVDVLEKALNPDLWQRFGEIMSSVADAAVRIGAPLWDLVVVFGEIAGKISAATWTALINVLNTLAPVLENIVVPALEKMSTFIAEHPGLVTAMVTAWLGMRGIGMLVAPLTAIAAPLITIAKVLTIMQISKELSLLGKSLGGAATPAGRLATNFSKLLNFFNPLGKAAQFVLTPMRSIGGLIVRMLPRLVGFIPVVGQIIAVVAAVGTALWAFFTKTETGRAVFEKLKETLANVWNWLKELAAKVWDIATDFADALKDIGLDILREQFDRMKEAAQRLWDQLAPVRDLVATTLSNAFDKAKDAVTRVRDAITPLWQKFKDLAAAIWDKVQPALEKIKDAFAAFMDKVGGPAVKIALGIVFAPLIAAAGIVVGAIFGVMKVFELLMKGISWLIDHMDWLKTAAEFVGNVLKTVFETIWTVAAYTIGIIGTVILTPLILAWKVLSVAIQFAWESIIKPAWEAFGNFLSWVWSTLIQPAFEAIKAGFQVVGDLLAATWNNVIKPVLDHFANTFRMLGNGLKVVWDSVIKPVLDLFANAFRMLGNGLKVVWDSVIKPVWDALGNVIRWVVDTLVIPAFNAFMNGLNVLRDLFNAAVEVMKSIWQSLSDKLLQVWNTIKAAVFDVFMSVVDAVRKWFSDRVNDMLAAWELFKTGLSAVWNWIDSNVLGAFRNALDEFKSFFNNVVDGIKQVWDTLRSSLAKPVNFMIDTVYNGGIVVAWNTIADFIPPLKKAQKVSPIAGYATGGRIRGPGTGTSDDVLMWGSNGEHMLTKQEVDQAGGHGHIYAMREMLRFGKPFSFDATGNIIPLPTDTDNTKGDLLGAAPGLFPKYKDGGEIRPLWHDQLAAAHRWAAKRHGRPYVFGGSAEGGSGTDCSGFMSGIANVIQGGNGARQWATMAFNGGGNSQYPSGPQGFVAGLKQGFSIGLTNGGGGGGHTAGTLSGVPGFGTVNVEAGGSPSMVKYGVGAAGADDGYFRTHYHLPIGADGAFESGGASGMSRDAMIDALKNKIKGIMEKVLGPIEGKIAGAIGTPPPEWFDIPPQFLKGSRTQMVDFAFDKIKDLGDLLSGAWAKATDFISELFDTGGMIQPGTTMVTNKTGKPEPVLNPAQWGHIKGLVAGVAGLNPILSDWVDNGIAELERIANATVRGWRDYAEANDDHNRLARPDEWARHYGEAALHDLGGQALGLFGLGGLADWEPGEATINLINAAADTANAELERNQIGFRFAHADPNALKPRALVDGEGRLIGDRQPAGTADDPVAVTSTDDEDTHTAPEAHAPDYQAPTTPAPQAGAGKQVSIELNIPPGVEAVPVDQLKEMMTNLQDQINHLERKQKADKVAAVTAAVTTMA
ncbi:tape measure protein [Corynebacterium pseudodiphtheriticum]|uniref:tape measure protein n=1 Tax=Corynebacterium pseudodiphtheriticum TaxID=37637 RepID=UPI00254397BF|nr:tape measure protein [Corynebacterium pseudodiphtheriticum]MDK4244021.1 tape measure protein [Corynebacterium pseudodiphtheriticum]